MSPDERTAVNNYLAFKYNLTPVIAIATPFNDAVLMGPTNISIAATAADGAGIAQVQFFEGGTSLGMVTNPPYSLVWSNVALGEYELTASAIDNNGLTFTSAVVNVTVAGIALTTPTNNTVLPAPANIPLNATVVDGAGVSQVRILQGTNVLATFTNTPYSFTWPSAPSGSYALIAQATGNDGVVLTSSVVNVTVDNPPSVTLTSPVNNARVTAGTNLSLGASASDSDGTVAQVQFFQGTNSLGISTSAPYGLVWSNVPAGTYALTACATDNNGLITTSAVVNLMVAGVAIISPTNYLVATAPASIPISALVTDNTNISQVQFFQGTTSLGILTSPPYNVAWNSVAAGNYVLTATVTDAGGLVFTSSVVNVIVDTNPGTTDQDGDGVSDYIEYLEGRNPLVNGSVPDTTGLVNLQIYTPLH